MKIFLLALAGTISGWFLMSHGSTLLPKAWASGLSESYLSTRSVEVVDSAGQRQIVFGQSVGGAPGAWFYDQKGRARLNFGLYDDGDPYIVLNDVNQQAVQILRLVGGRQPYLVLKNNGRDRIVMGLDGPNSNPSLSIYDPSGAKKIVFGAGLR